jgi:hypothetical protein
VAGRKPHHLFTLNLEEQIGAHQERASAALNETDKRLLDFFCRTRTQNFDLLPEGSAAQVKLANIMSVVRFRDCRPRQFSARY